MVTVHQLTGIRAAVAMVGGQRSMARALGVSPQLVCNWVARGYVPEPRAEQIIALLGEGSPVRKDDLLPL